jgi:hypothetical protein
MSNSTLVLAWLVYALAVGGYLGSVLGLRLNPDFFDHARDIVYPAGVLIFGVIVHCQRRLSWWSAWLAYVVCSLGFVGLTFSFGNEWKGMLDNWSVYMPAMLALLLLGGLAAQGAGRLLRRQLLPGPEKARTATQAFLPWLPLLALVAMAAHMAHFYGTTRAISDQRWELQRQTESAHGFAVSFVSQGSVADSEQDQVVVKIALAKARFSREEEIQILIVFRNEGGQEVSIAQPLSLAQWLRVRDPGGKVVPLNAPREWVVADIAVNPIELSPGDDWGAFVSLREWFSLLPGVDYRVSLVWRGLETEPLPLRIEF